MAKAVFQIEDTDYAVVIPHVQNLYGPEEVPILTDGRWTAVYQWGFKYRGGVFEYFTAGTLKEADAKYRAMRDAVEEYWMGHLQREISE